MRNAMLALAAVLLSGGCSAETPTIPASEALPVASLPSALDPNCREGRARIYDECGSQMAILAEALEQARATGKTVVVNYGAEWCIWCHVFDGHLRGATGRFNYPVEGEEVTLVERSGREVLADAIALNEFASSNFVVAHIEADFTPDGWQVLEATGAAAHFDDSYPFIFTVTADGEFATAFNHQGIERRRDTAGDWYRGYESRSVARPTPENAAASLAGRGPDPVKPRMTTLA